MALSRRNFLRSSLAGLGAAAVATALAPLVKIKRAGAATAGKRVIVVGIGGGLRLNESLGMAQGATMPNLFGTTPLVTGFATGAQGAPKIAPEYAQTAPTLALPAVRSTPLFTQGSLITNLRYADGPPGHLQGHGCLLSGYYNKLENRADAHLPVPTIFELHRRETNAPASDTWYVSQIGGFYRALIASDNPDFGNRYAGVYLQPPGAMSPFVPLITSGKRTLNLTNQNPDLPIIPRDDAEAAAASRLTSVLDKFRPSVMAITLLDVDTCHADFNGYLRAQQLADALVSHLWDFIQADQDLRDNTTMLVLPEHGRHLFFNGNNRDSLGRSGIDHGQGDNGDRDVWLLALGPDIKPNNVIAPTGIAQTGRTSGRYETIDAVMTAMSVLGHDAAMKTELTSFGARPGLIVDEVLR